MKSNRITESVGFTLYQQKMLVFFVYCKDTFWFIVSFLTHHDTSSITRALECSVPMAACHRDPLLPGRGWKLNTVWYSISVWQPEQVEIGLTADWQVSIVDMFSPQTHGQKGLFYKRPWPLPWKCDGCRCEEMQAYFESWCMYKSKLVKTQDGSNCNNTNDKSMSHICGICLLIPFYWNAPISLIHVGLLSPGREVSLF